MHDDRLVSQWKPVPQSLSPPQKPPSVHTPLEQKQPAAQLLSRLQEKPGGFPSPLGDVPLSFELPKYRLHPARDAVATMIARPTDESSLFMGGRSFGVR
jgi:hypothetical protein